MSNLTISIDEATVRQARIRAIQEGTSVSAKVREFLANYARGEQPASAAAGPVQLPTFPGRVREGIDPASNRAMEAAMETDDELIAHYRLAPRKRPAA